MKYFKNRKSTKYDYITMTVLAVMLFLCSCSIWGRDANIAGSEETGTVSTDISADAAGSTVTDTVETASEEETKPPATEAPYVAIGSGSQDDVPDVIYAPQQTEANDGVSVGIEPGAKDQGVVISPASKPLDAADDVTEADCDGPVSGEYWQPGTIYMDYAEGETVAPYTQDGIVAADTEGDIIEIVEGPDGAEIPVQGEIPTASAFTVFNADNTISSVVPEPQQPSEHIRWEACRIEGDDVVISASLEGGITPSNTKMGEDTNLYLLELKPYEDSIADHRNVTYLPKNAQDLTFRIPLNKDTAEDRLYNRFVACIWDTDHYIPVSEPVYINNPEAVAAYTDPYAEPLSKKGLLIERSQISDAFALGVCNVIVNIPFNHLMGEGIDYEYDGEIYHFSSHTVGVYDKTISAFSNKSMNVSVVLLNGFNANTPDFFYPGAKQTGAAKYHHFNAATQEGFKTICAVASFLAQRYNGHDADHGRVQNWIIGNEINNQEWNYLGPMDMGSYLHEYERAFRVFYNAIRSTCANDRVFFSLDHNWNREANGRTRYNARDVLSSLSALIDSHGNIDWGLAYHPYSEPMTEPEFWDDFSSGQATYYDDSPVVNFANLSLLTDYMQRPEMRDRAGHVRHIILSEEGFTSKSPTRGDVQKLQAAAFAYAYYIADSNIYIDSFILSRQIDAPSEVKQSLAFGLWTTSSITDANIEPLQKKYIWDVFKNIDRRSTTLEYTAFAKEILGISRWSDVIPNFRWARYEK
ncbi:MAG: Tat pathway signal protein [Lachnospiraceae bacterium]|nr:Tat pathway signal protein [Lachnospiraceae bacterium]